MPLLSNSDIELRLLSLFFQPPFHMRLLSLDENLFLKSSHKNLMKLMKSYVQKYKSPPTKKSLLTFTDELIKNKSDLDKFSDSLLILKKLPKVQPQEFGFYMEKVENYYVGRRIYDIADAIKNKFESEHEIDYKKFRRELLGKLLVAGKDSELIRRGFVYENVKDRWYRQKAISEGEGIEGLVPFGIKAFDDALGGMMRSFVTLIYSRTGGGKTRTSINIAYNLALLGFNVLYFTLEMAFDLIAICFDSRMALLDNNKIMYGKLDRKDRKKYKEVLKKQLKEKLNIWLVDIPGGATVANLYEETEIYEATTGQKPDLVVVDYAGLMVPMKPYTNTSERYGNLFEEYHGYARQTNSALLTAAMESRERSKLDKKIAELSKKSDTADEEVGVEGIGLSNYMAPHCEIVIRLVQNKFDRLQNRLVGIVDKHRYGRAFEKLELFALWELGYVGDRLVPGTKSLIIEKGHKNGRFN